MELYALVNNGKPQRPPCKQQSPFSKSWAETGPGLQGLGRGRVLGSLLKRGTCPLSPACKQAGQGRIALHGNEPQGAGLTRSLSFVMSLARAPVRPHCSPWPFTIPIPLLRLRFSVSVH
jgi:hypothetical protein